MSHTLVIILLALWLICDLLGFCWTVRRYRRAKRRDVLWVSADTFPLTPIQRSESRRSLCDAYKAAGIPEPIVIHVPSNTTIQRDPAR